MLPLSHMQTSSRKCFSSKYKFIILSLLSYQSLSLSHTHTHIILHCLCHSLSHLFLPKLVVICNFCLLLLTLPSYLPSPYVKIMISCNLPSRLSLKWRLNAVAIYNLEAHYIQYYFKFVSPAAIAQWNRVWPSFRDNRFESHAQNLCFN